jgi:hypothetical protein
MSENQIIGLVLFFIFAAVAVAITKKGKGKKTSGKTGGGGKAGRHPGEQHEK